MAARRDVPNDVERWTAVEEKTMTGYYSNLALHISDATLKAHRRLERPEGASWGYIGCAIAGAAAVWAVALVLM
jgi:uncharacterized protein (DUF2236 family)